MTKDPHSNTDPDLVHAKAEKFIASAGLRWAEATITTLVVVGIFAFVGWYLDSWWSTKPWLLIVGIVVSFPISQYVIYRRLKSRFKF